MQALQIDLRPELLDRSTPNRVTGWAFPHLLQILLSASGSG